MDRRSHAEPPGARLARSYLTIRAEQTAEQQPHQSSSGVKGSVRLPRLDQIHVNSPEAHAQYRLAVLARVAASGEAWFTLSTVSSR